VTVFRDVTSDLVQRLSSFFYSQGLDRIGAGRKALKVLDGFIMRQSSMLSFNHVFFLMAALFLFSIPLVFLIKDRQRNAGVDIAID
jgi:hypothetical protein